MSSLLAAKLVEAAKKRKAGGTDAGSKAAARAILAAIKAGDEDALSRALSSFTAITDTPPAEDD